MIIIFACLLFFSDFSTATDVFIYPKDQLILKGQCFSISIVCRPSEPIKAFEFSLSFDKSKIMFERAKKGNIFGNYEVFESPTMKIDNDNGLISNVYSLILGKNNVSCTSTLIIFEGKALEVTDGNPAITLINTGICNEVKYVDIIVESGKVEVCGINRFDVSGDGIVNTLDLSITWGKRDDYCLLYDVSEDGVINVLDVSLIWYHVFEVSD
jgi:hypothetical protein